MSNATLNRLDRLETLVQNNAQAIKELGQKVDQFAKEIKAETQTLRKTQETLQKTQEKWNERFFKMSRNMTNLAFGLIATATITIIVTSVFK